MTPFTVHTGRAAPLMLPNIDTDVIVRIERLTGVTRQALGRYTFEVLRWLPDGRENPEFVLNQPLFREASILVAGRNFACGSSREGAVWGLMEMGVRCVIAESFGGIFYSNCFLNGLLPIVLDAPEVARIAAAICTGGDLMVDLVRCRVGVPGTEEIAFEIDPFLRGMLLEGLDEITAIQRHAPAIAQWQARDRRERPWIWAGAPNT